MVIYQNFIYGTIREFAEMLTCNITVNNWTDYDFVLPQETNINITNGNNNFKKVLNSSGGWFGVKRVNTGFDNEEISIVLDYYGCGCGQYIQIDDIHDLRTNRELLQQKIIDVIAEHGDGELKPWDLLFIDKLTNEEQKGE